MTPTPSQARFMQEHRERRARFAARGRSDTGVACVSASVRSQRVDVSPVVLLKPVIPVQVQTYETWFAIDSEIAAPKPKIPSILTIQKATAEHFGLTIAHLISHRRLLPLVHARHIGIYLAKTMTARSMPEIARIFGQRNHTTILHSVRKIEHLLKLKHSLREEVEAIKSRIGADHG